MRTVLAATALAILALTGCATSPQYSGSVTPVRHPVWFNDPLPVGDYTYRSTMDATGGDKSGRMDSVSRYRVRKVEGGAKEVVITETDTTTPGNKIDSSTATGRVGPDGKVLTMSIDGQLVAPSELTKFSAGLIGVDPNRAYREGDVVFDFDLSSLVGNLGLSSTKLITCRLVAETMLHGGRAGVLNCDGKITHPKFSIEIAGYFVFAERGEPPGFEGDLRMVIRAPGEPVVTAVMHATSSPEA
jgi:hypothetical protein